MNNVFPGLMFTISHIAITLKAYHQVKLAQIRM